MKCKIAIRISKIWHRKMAWLQFRFDRNFNMCEIWRVSTASLSHVIIEIRLYRQTKKISTNPDSNRFLTVIQMSRRWVRYFVSMPTNKYFIQKMREKSNNNTVNCLNCLRISIIMYRHLIFFLVNAITFHSHRTHYIEYVYVAHIQIDIFMILPANFAESHIFQV